jgi:hypothetical protein
VVSIEGSLAEQAGNAWIAHKVVFTFSTAAIVILEFY